MTDFAVDVVVEPDHFTIPCIHLVAGHLRIEPIDVGVKAVVVNDEIERVSNSCDHRGIVAEGFGVDSGGDVVAVAPQRAGEGEDIAELASALASGELRSTVSQTYTFDQADEAIDALRGAVHAGKIVLTP